MTAKPVFSASEREKVLFPDPAIPVTTTRRPIAEGASPIDFSVPHVPVESHTGRRWLDSRRRDPIVCSGQEREPASATKHASQPCFADGVRTFSADGYMQIRVSVR